VSRFGINISQLILKLIFYVSNILFPTGINGFPSDKLRYKATAAFAFDGEKGETGLSRMEAV
jgi:hypothetical protein